MVFGLPFFLLSAGIVLVCAASAARNQRARDHVVDTVVYSAIRQLEREVDENSREHGASGLNATIHGLRLECGYRWVTDDPSGPADRFEVTLVDSVRRLIPLNLTINRHLDVSPPT